MITSLKYSKSRIQINVPPYIIHDNYNVFIHYDLNECAYHNKQRYKSDNIDINERS